ncbi:MAG: signal recognition particle protein [Betaproteobacteria bacterium TMED156]|nr:MAG: signal recognition particle protein [Betaproteobacteria bacterium TMED156]
MFESLSQKMTSIVKHIKGEARITEKNTLEIAREIRLALLEADVALPVVKDLINQIKVKSLGAEVLDSLTPGQTLVGIVKDELIKIMGDEEKISTDLNFKSKPPATILLAGLQGAGKTTTCGKLAYWLKKQQKNIKILTTSCDVYRPAAIKQLETISKQAGVDFYNSHQDESPAVIAEKAVAHAKKFYYEVLLVDTAGRLSIDLEMMNEINNLQKIINPVETLFVIDSMQGQDALEVAKNFNNQINLTGIVLTKADGDSRGGSLLSVKSVTGCPTKFVGVSEKLDGLEKFDAERFTNRILGMGDILSLVEKAKETIENKSATELAKKLQRGKTFTLNEFRLQISQMRSMGGLSSIMGMLPSNIVEAAKGKDLSGLDNSVKKQEGIILSMTPLERKMPEIIKASRKKRIASGAGVSVQEVNKLMNQFTQMQNMMKRMGGGALNKIMNSMGGLPGTTKPNLKNLFTSKKRKNKRTKRR